MSANAGDPFWFVQKTPATYNSPSGDYALLVSPKRRFGINKAHYTITHEGKQIWSCKKQFALDRVVVTDRGYVIGSAHDGYCHLVIWDTAGRIMLDEWFEQYMQLHSGPEPYVKQILVSEGHDFVTFRLHGQDSRDGKRIGSLVPAEVWSSYRISTGELMHEYKAIEQYAKLDSRLFVIDAQIIPGTPLILVHWYDRGLHSKKEERSSQFSLVDIAGQPIWSLRMDKDYTDVDMPRKLRSGGPIPFFSKNPAILASNISHQFKLRRFADDRVLTFSVKKQADNKWSIREESQADFVPKNDK
ncbi:hypothetical protein JYU10_00545 [bacterium AH-315-J04]|nr:hypothetical protein [bacterium AH-315-J04]